jgi:hypothetical protein
MRQVVANGLGGAFAAAIEGAIVIAQRQVAPGRFCMSQEENLLHGCHPIKCF